MRRVIAIILIAAVRLTAQQVGENAPIGVNQPATFTAGTQLVVETVSVTDKQGRPVQGLTAKDFGVTENGVPQMIRFFEQQKLPESPAPLVASAPENIHIYDKLGRTQITPEHPGSPRYRNRRLLALYFDMTAMPPTDQLRALDAAVKFVRTQMTAADLV